MNHAQAASQDPRKPDLGNTGQYTISVSKPGTGEDPEPHAGETSLRITFKTDIKDILKPVACRVALRSDDNNAIDEGRSGFDADMKANVVLKLDEWQNSWWVDVYLEYGSSNPEVYAVSAYLSTLIVDKTTVSCVYQTHPQPNRRDG